MTSLSYSKVHMQHLGGGSPEMGDSGSGASPTLVYSAQGTATAPTVAADWQPGQIPSFPQQLTL